MDQEKPYDLIIIGASAAGVSAAVYASRRKLNFLLVTVDIGGEVATSGEIENYLGFPQTDGLKLAELFQQQLEYNHVSQKTSTTVERIERQPSGFFVHGSSLRGPAQWPARSVILATGAHPRELRVPGEKELRGKGVTYCTTCDGPLFKGKRVVTIGGGNSALESALMLAEIADHVTLLTKNAALRGEKVLIDRVTAHPKIDLVTNAETTAILGQTSVTGLRYTDTAKKTEQTIETRGVFIHIGLIPNSSIVDGVEKTPNGEIVVDSLGRTNVPGLFAAGDVTNTPYKQIAVAAGQGTAAALSAISYLNGQPGR